MNEFYSIGVDLGGTKVHVGLVKDNQVIKSNKQEVPKNTKDEWDVINLIIKLIENTKENHQIKGIGIGVPSILDRVNGIIHEVQNIPTWQEVHLAKILKDHFHVPVFLDNDANCFALGEYQFGKGNRCANMVGITLGTGMGTGIITNHQLMGDANGGSGEFGMIPYKNGVIEDYCSGQFFKNNSQLAGEEIYTLAKQGNAEALELYQEFGKHLAHAVKTILFALDPEKIVFGGSIVKASDFFDESLRSNLQDFAYKKVLNSIQIEYSNNSDIAILGAAALVL